MLAKARTSALDAFRAAVDDAIGRHPIVRRNAYTEWFATGVASDDELRRFTVQFSVFSHLFIEAQLRKCINARDIESYRAGKEILLNELGVTFAPSGSVEGGTFRFRAGHFEWLAQFAESIGLQWNDIGKREHGSPETLAFCDALVEWYGSHDESTAAGASYAIEHWAAAGFWKQLILGLRAVKTSQRPDLPLGFWTWHDALEDQHAAHTGDELTAAFEKPNFSPARFIRAGQMTLDAVETFWRGLDATRPRSAL
ncbi:MAG: hypothetical protein JO322_11705 [Candidatus Eremiobacteraeota bacterium]|nr:hypothetical protein [Candidatus Eremiobacteraeota bacterium]